MGLESGMRFLLIFGNDIFLIGFFFLLLWWLLYGFLAANDALGLHY